jgi:hypothetical protein
VSFRAIQRVQCAGQHFSLRKEAASTQAILR